MGVPLAGLKSLGLNTQMKMFLEMVEVKYVPQAVSDENGAGCKDAQVGVVLLCEEFQVVGVLAFPLSAAILEPDLDLHSKQCQ